MLYIYTLFNCKLLDSVFLQEALAYLIIFKIRGVLYQIEYSLELHLK